MLTTADTQPANTQINIDDDNTQESSDGMLGDKT